MNHLLLTYSLLLTPHCQLLLVDIQLQGMEENSTIMHIVYIMGTCIFQTHCSGFPGPDFSLSHPLSDFH